LPGITANFKRVLERVEWKGRTIKKFAHPTDEWSTILKDLVQYKKK